LINKVIKRIILNIVVFWFGLGIVHTVLNGQVYTNTLIALPFYIFGLLIWIQYLLSKTDKSKLKLIVAVVIALLNFVWIVLLILDLPRLKIQEQNFNNRIEQFQENKQ
jgi:hypothetical protein